MNSTPQHPQLSPQDQEFLAFLAHVYLQNGKPDKAAVILTALDLAQPNRPLTLAALAAAQIRSDKASRALETLDRLAMSGRIDAVFHLLRGQALNALGRKDEATLAMQTYLQMRAASTPDTRTDHGAGAAPQPN